MRIDLLSLFPSCFAGPLDESIIKRARESGLLEINLVNIRGFADGKHKCVDDRPYGGGPGMVMMAKPVVDAIRSVKTAKSRAVYLSPQGELLKAKKCEHLSKYDHLILLCGHYEGIDQRAIEIEVDETISIGDYVLTNGCLPAMVLVDAVARFIPGVIGNEDAAKEDSFQNGLFDCPHYTRPESFEGHVVPQALLEGNHAKIKKWRHEQALKNTKKIRPDLFEKLGRRKK